MTDRTPIFFDTAEIQNIEAVQEMARVGIIVSREKAPVGHRFDMAGPALRSHRAMRHGKSSWRPYGGPPWRAPEAFDQCSAEMHFMRISTD